jgi:hypothetical protein
VCIEAIFDDGNPGAINDRGSHRPGDHGQYNNEYCAEERFIMNMHVAIPPSVEPLSEGRYADSSDYANRPPGTMGIEKASVLAQA